VCNFNQCPTQPTRCFRCTSCGFELFLCDVHNPPSQCFTCKGGSFYLHRRLDVQQQNDKENDKDEEIDDLMQSLVDDRVISMSNNNGIEEVEETTTPCGLRGTSELAWCETTNDLVLSIEICKDVKVEIGHSFGAMSAREAYLREEAGTTVKNSSANGPNNAMCELRILLVNERCEALQIAVRFRDNNGNHLLFRSTGGCVLQQDPEDAKKTFVRSHDCDCTASDGYLKKETFVHAGCYSFFDQIDDAYDEPRLMTPDKYKDHHEGEYCKLVETSSSNAQHFHHSEQSIFKLLYDYPNVVADAIIEVMSNLNSGFFTNLKGIPIVAALVLDIFTTRTACVDCLTAGKCVRTKNQHFFGQALKDVVKTLSGKIGVANQVTTVIRFAAAVAFTGCPSKKALENLEKQTSSAMLHALPSEDIAITTLGLNEPPIVFLNVAVPVNANSCMTLLTTGTISRERTDVMIALSTVRQLLTITRVDQIPKAVANSGLNRKMSKVVMAIALWERVAPKTNEMAFLYQGGSLVVPFVLRLECVLEVAVVCKIGIDDIVYAILRNYRAFFEGHKNMPQPFDAVAVLKIVNKALIASFKLGTISEGVKNFMPLLGKALGTKSDAFADTFLKMIKEEIADALREQTATGENRARNLAIEFNLLDYYKEQKGK
jgi:hypothetical protein